jgi:phosphate:Na+ symporter
MGTTVLLNLVGGIALLLWGLHMVQSGILRAFGADLRRVLAITLRNRFAALLAGVGITALLQSSTATALMTATFLGDGLVGLVPALAIMLGANIGTTLIVQVFSFDVSMLAPVLLGIGVIVFKNSVRTKIRDLGRVAVGLGLMLLSLHILLDTLSPAESAPNVRALLSAITGMPILNVIFGAVLAWAAHSSVAVVLLVISLAYSHFITPVVAFALAVPSIRCWKAAALQIPPRAACRSAT